MSVPGVQENQIPETYRVYRRRWLMLFIFCTLYFIGGTQWVQYTIIQNIVMKYYGISATMTNMTSVIFLITYLPLVIPASYITNKKKKKKPLTIKILLILLFLIYSLCFLCLSFPSKPFITILKYGGSGDKFLVHLISLNNVSGVRYVMILAVIGHFIGAWVKVFSAHPNKFYIGLIGQTIVAVSQTFVISMPPKLASIWFAKNQISTACTIGYYGSIFGLSAGFFFVPIIVQDNGNMDDIGHNLFVLFLIIAIITTVVLFSVIAFFQEEPPIFPSEVQQINKQKGSNTLESYRNILTNGPFVMLFCSYSLNVGVSNTINTLFNPILLEHFKTDGEQFAGRVGVCFLVSSCFSTIIFGIILDKTKKFKETTVILYGLSVVLLLAFNYSIVSEIRLLVYLSAFIMGFFMNGYIPVAYETGVELTYPESEFDSTGVLSSGSHTMGGVFSILFTWVLERTNGFWTNISLTMLLVIGFIITILTRNVRKRQHALQ